MNPELFELNEPNQQEAIKYPECSFEEGIYFGLPEEEYHAAKALSCSGMKKLLVSELQGWNYLVNPYKEEDADSNAREYGKAAHRYILEPETFNDAYFSVPDDAPTKPTSRQINAKKPSPDSIYAIRYWQTLMFENKGKRIIKKEWLEDFKAAHEMLQYYPEIKDTFKGGYPEVSIFLKQNDIMFKCRIDYLTPFGVEDLKTFSNSRDKTIDEAIKSSIIYEKYNLQYYIYSNLLKEAKKRLRAGKLKIFGEVKEQFLHDLADHKEINFNLVFQESSAPYETRKIGLIKSFAEGSTPNVYWSNAENMFKKAVERYSDGFRKYGNKPWIGDTTSYILSDEEIPNIIYQQF